MKKSVKSLLSLTLSMMLLFPSFATAATELINDFGGQTVEASNDNKEEIIIEDGQLEVKEESIDKNDNTEDNIVTEPSTSETIESESTENELNSIDESIPTSVNITKLDVRYDENLVKHNDNGKDQEKTPLYEQIPNLITIEGNASYTRNVGQFLYELNNSIYFKKAKLENLKKDENKGMYSYIIKAYLKEGVVLNG